MNGNEKSRIPLPVNTALERMNLSAVTPAAAMPDAHQRGRLLHDYRPLCQSLEWKVAQAHWHGAGLLAFIDSEVPFLINNSGRLSRNAASVLFTHCQESETLPPTISVLEIGAGTGLFARYFLDFFRALCEEKSKDYYQRLTYVVTDSSPQTAAQWRERGIFEPHAGRVSMAVFDPMEPRDDPSFPAELQAVICNYVLDVLPSTVVRATANGPAELRVRTYLTADAALLASYTTRTVEEIASLAASETDGDLLELVPLLPLLELETAFQPIAPGSIPFLEEAIRSASGDSKVLLNYGALQTLGRFLELVAPPGFFLINDYGPVRAEQVDSYGALQRFGPTVAFGINFALLESHCTAIGISVSRSDDDDDRGIHTRLLSRADLPRTRAVLRETFSAQADRYHQSCLDDARAHVAAGRLNEAVDAYRQALTRDPRNWHLLGEAGEFLSLQLRSFEAALELLRAAVALNPYYSAWLWNALGDALYCLDRQPDAHEAYLQAARIDPDDPRTNLNLAYTLAHFGRLGDALNAIARGLARDSGETFRTRLLDKQRHLLTLLSNRWRAEHESLVRRAARFQAA